ncbi:dynamin-like 120 kDa protein, mitochondrial isoform X3 [Zophobas morio]
MADTLPRVVVVGDQSSGKTSVLEMLAQTRMFPRGAGEMMTRTPVQVTLYEGPSRVACFADSDRIFNLTSEEELTELRREIYNRMQRAVKEEETVSAATISLYVQGPGLPRMVLVDLPGIINHVTTGMAEGTKETIWDMSRRQMANPNAIILCIQDGSVDAERSSVSDLVSSVDPTGSRTVFVLTKLDVAEANNIGSQRIKSVMEGKLFRMNALGYFAVIAGKGNGQESIEEIRQYEEEYFRNSRLFREGALSPHQTSLTNLSRAVSREFWRLVKETVADHFEQLKADLTKKETEWRNSFKGRPMSRDELFQLGKHVILESIDKFNSIGAKSWENILYERIWCDISGHLIDNIYMQAAKHFCPNEFRTRVDVELLDWARRSLTSSCIAASRDMFIREFENFIMNTSVDSSNDLEPLFKGMKEKIVANRRQQGAWLTAVSDNLRVIQLTALADDEICDEADWRNSCVFMEHRLTERKKVLDEQYRKYFGPEFWEQLFYWRSRDELQARRAAIRHELRDYFATGQPVEELSSDDIIGIRSNITRARSLEVDDEMIKEVYRVLFTNYFFKSSIAASRFCKNAYHFHDAELAYAPNKLECQDIIMFWRIQEMLKITSKTLRQQILMQKAHLEQEVKDELETYTLSDSVKKELIRGKRVELAEEIEIARVIKNKLENFIFQLKTQSSNLKEL